MDIELFLKVLSMVLLVLSVTFFVVVMWWDKRKNKAIHDIDELESLMAADRRYFSRAKDHAEVQQEYRDKLAALKKKAGR